MFHTTFFECLQGYILIEKFERYSLETLSSANFWNFLELFLPVRSAVLSPGGQTQARWLGDFGTFQPRWQLGGQWLCRQMAPCL